MMNALRHLVREELIRILNEDEDWHTTDGVQFWGKAGAGILCVAGDTGRILLTFRSAAVDQPHTWGLPGGALRDGQSPSDAARVELGEETGYRGPIDLKPAYVFKKGTFSFYNFIGRVPTEFKVRLDWENEDYGWFDIDELPTPLHFGVKALLDNTSEDEIAQLQEHLFIEAAVTPRAASKDGLALAIGKSNSCRYYMLYDPIMFSDVLKQGTVDARSAHNHDVKVKLRDIAIKGVLFVKPGRPDHAWNAAIVAASAAEHGYGPLMYDIVMSREGGLVPDRSSVRPSAKKVWQYYFDNRSDVKAKPLDDIDDPKTKPKVDDAYLHRGGTENPLNYAYFTRRRPNVDAMIERHKEMLRGLKKLRIDETFIEDVAWLYFDRKY